MSYEQVLFEVLASLREAERGLHEIYLERHKLREWYVAAEARAAAEAARLTPEDKAVLSQARDWTRLEGITLAQVEDLVARGFLERNRLIRDQYRTRR